MPFEPRRIPRDKHVRNAYSVPEYEKAIEKGITHSTAGKPANLGIDELLSEPVSGNPRRTLAADEVSQVGDTFVHDTSGRDPLNDTSHTLTNEIILSPVDHAPWKMISIEDRKSIEDQYGRQTIFFSDDEARNYLGQAAYDEMSGDGSIIIYPDAQNTTARIYILTSYEDPYPTKRTGKRHRLKIHGLETYIKEHASGLRPESSDVKSLLATDAGKSHFDHEQTRLPLAVHLLAFEDTGDVPRAEQDEAWFNIHEAAEYIAASPEMKVERINEILAWVYRANYSMSRRSIVGQMQTDKPVGNCEARAKSIAAILELAGFHRAKHLALQEFEGHIRTLLYIDDSWFATEGRLTPITESDLEGTMITSLQDVIISLYDPRWIERKNEALKRQDLANAAITTVDKLAMQAQTLTKQAELQAYHGTSKESASIHQSIMKWILDITRESFSSKDHSLPNNITDEKLKPYNDSLSTKMHMVVATTASELPRSQFIKWLYPALAGLGLSLFADDAIQSYVDYVSRLKRENSIVEHMRAEKDFTVELVYGESVEQHTTFTAIDLASTLKQLESQVAYPIFSDQSPFFHINLPPHIVTVSESVIEEFIHMAIDAHLTGPAHLIFHGDNIYIDQEEINRVFKKMKPAGTQPLSSILIVTVEN